MKGKMNLLQKAGVLLVAVGCLLALGTELLGEWNRRTTENLGQQIRASLPRITEGNPENYTDMDMPVLQLEQEDFCGLLQVPAFGVSLPIGANWKNNVVSRYPNRFWGSAYDNSLIIGGSGRKDQFAFCGKLDLGDEIRVTDMTGAQFSYEVAAIDRSSHANMDVFQQKQSDLILFARDNMTLDYIIVRGLFVPGFQNQIALG